MKLKILRGLPGSGKSTYAKKFVEENKDWVRVCRDDLRWMRGQYWISKQEDMITDWENLLCLIAFRHGYNVIIDATNFNKERVKSRFNYFKTFFPELEYHTHEFNVSVEECIKNDLKRPNSVGEKVIRDFYNKYLAPPKVLYEEGEDLPPCIIVDVDGTIAEKGDRNPFDWKKVGEDTPIDNIIDIIRMFHNTYHIIFFSGRDGICESETREWLKKQFSYVFNEQNLFMRKEGDNRKDTIIKKELFEQHIRGKYNCKGVFDDRNSVVKMFREELGLTVLQVAEGDF